MLNVACEHDGHPRRSRCAPPNEQGAHARGSRAASSLVSAVAGQPVRGTWWSHPRANLIFELANAIEDSGEALVVKMVAGKVTFVHAALWPALCRVVTDATFRKGALAALSPIAKKLVMRIEQAGYLKLDDVTPDERRAFSKAKSEVEKAMAALVTSVHTERGTTVLCSSRGRLGPLRAMTWFAPRHC